MDRIPDISNTAPRARILAAASRIIATEGVEAATTRAVAAAAEVQAPTLYRLFGDKEGLLDAVAEQAMADYVAGKTGGAVQGDPLEGLRDGWDAHVGFGLGHPGLFTVLVIRQQDSAAVRQGLEVLRGKIRRLAQAGRLRVTEARALDLLQAGATGVILTLLRQPREARDGSLSQDTREAVLRVLTGDDPGTGSPPEPRQTAITLRSQLPQIGGLSPGEGMLLAELLHRIASASPDQPG